MATGTIDRTGERRKLGDNVPVTYLYLGDFHTGGKQDTAEKGVIVRDGQVVSVYIGGIVLGVDDFAEFVKLVLQQVA